MEGVHATSEPCCMGSGLAVMCLWASESMLGSVSCLWMRWLSDRAGLQSRLPERGDDLLPGLSRP